MWRFQNHPKKYGVEHPEITKCLRDFGMWCKMLRNSHISMPFMTLFILHILTPHITYLNTPLTCLEKCQKYAKLLHTLRLLVEEILEINKAQKKYTQNILETKENHMKIDVMINLETYNYIKFSDCCIFWVTIFGYPH